MHKKTILFLSGIADDRKAGFVRFSESGVQEYDLYGSCNLFSHMRYDGIEAILSILTPDNTQTVKIGGLYGVFNQISDADTHLQALLKADSLFNQIPDTIQKFNRPSAVLKTTREQISESLQGIEGLHVPKTVRIHPRSPDEIVDAIQEGAFGFPVIFRPAGAHAGAGTSLIHDEYEKFYPYALDGRGYYLTQFVDCADQGVYTKIRLAVVDGEVYIRHCIKSREWMIHAKNKEKQYEDEEHATIARFESEIKPLIQPLITEIHKRIGLDYFGIDCAIDPQMRMTIFEINANMNILVGGTSFSQPYVDRIREAVLSMIGR